MGFSALDAVFPLASSTKATASEAVRALYMGAKPVLRMVTETVKVPSAVGEGV